MITVMVLVVLEAAALVALAYVAGLNVALFILGLCCGLAVVAFLLQVGARRR